MSTNAGNVKLTNVPRTTNTNTLKAAPNTAHLSAQIEVLIIDPQRDFIDEEVPGGLVIPLPDGTTLKLGRLPVVNSKDDMPRISSFLKDNVSKINKVYVSMDTHTVQHIGHRFWKATDDSIARGGTFFSVKDDKIMGSDGKEYHVNVSPEHVEAMDKYAKAYITQVGSRGKDGRNAVNTWNVHCIEGQPGWQIQPTVKAALDSMRGKVEYYIKGQNQLAEMYSIFAAEVPYEDIIADSAFTDAEKTVIQSYVYNPANGDNTTLSTPIKPNDPSVGLVTAGKMLETYTNHTVFPTPNPPKGMFRTAPSSINLNTTFNEELFNRLTESGNDIVVCGEALSHCVQFSVRDLVEKIKATGKTNKVILIENASSYVVLPPPDTEIPNAIFKKSAEDFITYMKSGNGGLTDTIKVFSGKNMRGLLNRIAGPTPLEKIRGVFLGWSVPSQKGGRRTRVKNKGKKGRSRKNRKN